MKHLFAGLCAIFVFGTMAGCTEIPAPLDDIMLGFKAQCTTDSDCPEGTYCKGPYDICVTAEHNQSSVAVAATPPADAGLTTSHLGPLALAQDNSLDLDLPQTVAISGVVRVQGNNLEGSVPSTLVAIAKDEVIKGTLMRAQANATEKGFSLLLEKGRTYALSIRIDNAEPKVPVHRVEVKYDKSKSNVELLLPPATSYPLVSGRIFREKNGIRQPLNDLEITAIHEGTREQCTSSITNKLGAYEIRCPVTKGAYQVLVSPTVDGPIIPSFKARFQPVENKVDSGDEPAEPMNTVIITGDKVLDDIVVVTDQAETVSAKVQVIDPSGKGVAGVELNVTAAVTQTDFWTDATFRAEITTDVNGIGTFEALSGNNYRVIISPHPSDELAMHKQNEWDVSSQPTLEIQLGKKVELRGSVVDFHDASVEGTLITAHSSWINPVTKTKSVRKYTTTTLEDGTFILNVDPGEMVLSLEPNATSGLPRFWVELSEPVGSEGMTLQPIKLAAPSLVEGFVLSGSGDPLANVSVDFYSQPNTDGTARLLARGQSNDEGRYLVVLPCPK